MTKANSESPSVDNAMENGEQVADGGQLRHRGFTTFASAIFQSPLHEDVPKYACGWGLEPHRKFCRASSRSTLGISRPRRVVYSQNFFLVLASNERRTLSPVLHPCGFPAETDNEPQEAAT